MPRLIDRQESLVLRSLSTRDREERVALERQMRHAEYGGVDGEAPRMPDGILMDGRDPYADLRAQARARQAEMRAREAKEGRHTLGTHHSNLPSRIKRRRESHDEH